MVARLHGGDAWADIAHDASAFMPQDGGKQSLGIETIQRVGIGVANAGCHDFDKDLAVLRPVQIELDDFQGALGLESDRGTCFHGCTIADKARTIKRGLAFENARTPKGCKPRRPGAPISLLRSPCGWCR